MGHFLCLPLFLFCMKVLLCVLHGFTIVGQLPIHKCLLNLPIAADNGVLDFLIPSDNLLGNLFICLDQLRLCHNKCPHFLK